MSDSTELTVAEQPRQLMTIEPVEYVAQVFEPFAKQFEEAKNAVREVAYDITTTAGMATAIKMRAAFRDIRVASEKARKVRKAPILEIGKLLDSRASEIEATLLPLETMFDEEIKEQERRKDDEKIAKALAESARITAVRKKIDEIKDCLVVAMGRASGELESAISELESAEVTLEEYAEFSGEAQAAQADTVAKLKVMLAAQQAHEANAARLAAEREQLERERAEATERERQAVAARAEQERKDREARAAEERRLQEIREEQEATRRAAQAAAEAAMRQQQAEHEERMKAQQAELARQQAVLDAARAEQERVEQARQEVERRKREAEEAEQKIEADHAEALADNAAIDAARAAAEEALRKEEQRQFAEAERLRRERVQFEKFGPAQEEILSAIAEQFEVSREVAQHWLSIHNWHVAEKAA